jgi:hypothetical protein
MNPTKPCDCDAGVDPSVFKFSMGAAMIAIERQRQVRVEGYTRDHDGLHEDFQLLQAALHYAATCFPDDRKIAAEVCPFPFSPEYNKANKHNIERKLVIAGALIAAQLDLLVDFFGDSVNYDEDQQTLFEIEPGFPLENKKIS